jgi:transcriptional regulator with XRE-family HTH domain
MAPDCRSPNSVDRHVGKRVREARNLRGVGQERLAVQLGLTFQQIQKYEKGVNRIAASRLLAIAQLLQVPVEFFYDGAPNDEGPAASSAADERELLRTVLAVRSPENRRLLMEVARVMVGREPPAQAHPREVRNSRVAARNR